MTIDFEQHRSHLRGVAYRMLGSLTEADDAVQEAWLRLHRAEPSDVTNPRGWLTTVVARISLDMLRARTSRHEVPHDGSSAQHSDSGGDGGSSAGSDDPRASDNASTGATNAEQELVLVESVGRALLVVLDKLEPAERIAFVLHDLCDMPFDEIATIVGRSPEATRQLASRARRRVQGSRPSDDELVTQRRVVASFVTALRHGDVGGLLAILDPDVVVRYTGTKDNVPEVRGAETAAAAWVKGATAFAQFADMFTQVLIDGAVGLVMAPKGRVVRAMRFTFVNGRIATADIIADGFDELDIAPTSA